MSRFHAAVREPARYVDLRVPAHQGNPYIEALGNPPDPASFLTSLEYLPAIPTAQERNEDTWTRLSLIETIRDIIYPTAEFRTAATRLTLMIRAAYSARNPMENLEQRRLTAVANWNITGDLKLPNGWKSKACGHLVMSPTGTGKTTFINAFLLRLPQVIEHTNFRGKPFSQQQIVYLKISVPPDGTLKALCLTFFAEVDRLLGTTNYLRQAMAAETVPKMTILMGRVASAVALGLLVIDEFQNLQAAKTERGVFVLNLFVSLIEDIGVSVVTVATPKAFGLLQKKLRDTRKLLEGGMTSMRLMDKDSPEWELFCKTMLDYSYTKEKPVHSRELQDSWFRASGGNAGFAVTAFRMAQELAIIQDQPLDATMFELVLNTDMAALKPAIETLVKRDHARMAEFEDLMSDPTSRALAEMMAAPSFEPEPSEATVFDGPKTVGENIGAETAVPLKALIAASGEFSELTAEDERPNQKTSRRGRKTKKVEVLEVTSPIAVGLISDQGKAEIEPSESDALTTRSVEQDI